MKRKLIKNFYETALQAGLPVVSEEDCAELLAVLYVLGGGNEKFTEPLLAVKCIYCAKKYGLQGGQKPYFNFVQKLQKKIKEVEDNIDFYKQKYDLR